MENIIKGNPTKKFFIDMITRDISIEDAIIDLLDNSIDGANRINSDDYSGKYIEITIDANSFIIKDNCGGFSLETAKEYAFRFGRPEEAPKTENTVGRFGIGMKRALFKMGKSFKVASKHGDDHFCIDVDVDKWSNQVKTIKQSDDSEIRLDDWDFKYVETSNNNLTEDGTIIEITSLVQDVKSLFDDEDFIRNLRDSISKILNLSILKGIEIKVNNKKLGVSNIQLLISDDNIPYIEEGQFGNVKYRIIAGLGKNGVPRESGWYIYCNNRLVLEADHSSISGWGVDSIPKWHINYAMFRGIVFLDSKETIELPLTTTKKGIDATSDIYKRVFILMKKSMRHVLGYLKLIPKLGDDANTYRNMISENFNCISVIDLKTHNFPKDKDNFKYPEISLEQPQKVRIAYDIDRSFAEKVKDYAEVSSFKELGESTFNYYVKAEGIKNE